jgi:hypothetical protein
MRIKDIILKCVGYVAEVASDTPEGPEYDPVGTGFFVMVPSAAVPGGSYAYFVTAKHVAHGLTGKRVAFLVNKRDGGRAEAESTIKSWYMSPDTDIAVTPMGDLGAFDVICISINSFVTESTMRERDIGIGDEVFTAGLFVHAHGDKANLPIARTGNIAMIPEEQIYIDMGAESKFVDAYLVESRSIGGLSGSPVFVRPTAYVSEVDNNETGTVVAGVSGNAPLLLGLMHGHWDVKESEINQYSCSYDAQRGVNMGIGVVIPAHKIKELLFSDPDLLKLREYGEAIARNSIAPNRR